MLGDVYQYDAEARVGKLSPTERLRFHQQHSGPVMQQLHQWSEAQFALKQVEPNSGLGKAITYLLRHWKGLTAFLREAGAPLDNNLCERALKRAVLHRKNALSYRTLHGAEADLFMSLIHTCELSGANPFDYLTQLQKHPTELASNPPAWTPWNYSETLARSEYHKSYMAEKDRLRPCGSDTLKWPPNRTLREHPRPGFLVSDENIRKCSASACTPVSPQTISRHSRCRRARCGSMLRGGAGLLPCRFGRSAPERLIDTPANN
jgi:hypothetical protein